ncbi:MAG TPA: TIGR01777 family oxidoreductase [Tepidisphaeraceae bacterium]|nr:TIGR01777 family oxidoreductase [Tepidisphaeraceae bacterium]
MPQNKVILAGGSGFLGQALVPFLLKRFESIIVLTRNAARSDGPVRYVSWDAKSQGPWTAEIDGATAIVNLVGRTVDCRKTPANKREILESRVHSVRALAAACNAVANPPNVWVQAGTAHIYGDTADEILDESSPLGSGFAPDVGRAWEAAFDNADLPNCRHIMLRTSFVLGRHGGALATLAKLTRCFLGGTVATGRQYISWIHVDDFCRIVMRAIENPTMEGVYVVTAPNPVTNRDFMAALRRTLHRPWSPPAPAACVRLASLLMRTDPELALLGRRCIPTRLMREVFEFQFPKLNDALRELLL